MSSVDPAAPASSGGNPRRRTALLSVGAVVLVGAIAYGIYWALVLNHFESTDNAYVQGNVVQLTPQIAGTVVAIAADDTDAVAAGQSLVKLDPADARVALDQAEAQLAQAVRETRILFVNNSALQGADRITRSRAGASAQRCGEGPRKTCRAAHPWWRPVLSARKSSTMRSRRSRSPRRP